MFDTVDSKVLPRIKIHWDKCPTEFEKGGPFRKYRALVNFPYMYMTTMVYQSLDTVRIFIISAFNYLGLKITDNMCKL